MEDFEEWRENMNGIYDKFNRNGSPMNGTTPNIPKSQGGYICVLRHPKEISEKVANFSERISNCIPSLMYDADTIHTTIFDYSLSEEFESDETILKDLCGAASNIGRNDVSINYSEWLYNPNTVLVVGDSNKQFLEIAEKMKTHTQKKGIEPRLAWGAHITTNRFTEEKTRNELSDFFKLMKEAPILGKSNPRYMDIGHFIFDRQGFNITSYERFSLN